MTKIYNQFKGRNFTILGVSLDDEKSRAKWLKAIAEDKLAWTIVLKNKTSHGFLRIAR